MVQPELLTIRQLAKNGAFSESGHAHQQMLDRSIFYDDIESVLTSESNQILEKQSPSCVPSKTHLDERILIYDPCYCKEIILVCVVMMKPIPEIRIITAEPVDPCVWKKNNTQVPGLIRIKK